MKRKMLFMTCWLFCAVALMGTMPARAAVVDFGDITAGDIAPIPATYQGLTWEVFDVSNDFNAHGVLTITPNSGAEFKSHRPDFIRMAPRGCYMRNGRWV